MSETCNTESPLIVRERLPASVFDIQRLMEKIPEGEWCLPLEFQERTDYTFGDWIPLLLKAKNGLDICCENGKKNFINTNLHPVDLYFHFLPSELRINNDKGFKSSMDSVIKSFWALISEKEQGEIIDTLGYERLKLLSEEPPTKEEILLAREFIKELSQSQKNQV